MPLTVSPHFVDSRYTCSDYIMNISGMN
ncbi:hypothetical protein EU527_01985 [Candidatus Thorarchaeota archaeon]|nr:MAG: hypothetical protein EU527_01985 [Candidatus Thorarchaeota archaeon]